MAHTPAAALTIEDLRAALVRLTEKGGAWGANFDAQRPVMVSIGGVIRPLGEVTAMSLMTGFACVLLGQDDPA